MNRALRISLLALACAALLAGGAAADELEGAAGSGPAAPPAGAPTGPARPAPPELSVANYRLELLLIGLAVGLVANYFSGSQKNAALAAAWEGPISDVLRANFSAVGDGRRVLERDSAADMLFYASGRRHCRFAQGHMVLRARQDPIALASDLLAGAPERLEVEVELEDDAFEGFVFAAVLQKRSRAVGRDRYDISTFASSFRSDRVPARAVVFSECADATGQLLDSGLDAVLADEDALLEEIYVTDCPAEKPESHDFKRAKKVLATIRLPPEPTAADAQRLREALEFVFYLVDYVAEAVRLRPESARKAAKARAAAFKEFARQAELEKQEAVAKIAADRRRAERAEADKMSPEQRRKWEEKERKRALKKSLNRRTRVIK
ncbi:hypothetical protein H4R18_000030 [Coemansia javaensis]|uniref:DUF1682 domain-containing protein n=1 Tax=Coemansia javaensis TaxID=2761396 RepID=A0A9W8HNR4_9FUNG|nr:hypothetical protein H4R18_000030 [Coemansia javaensis]